jgi:hypothetical protein
MSRTTETTAMHMKTFSRLLVAIEMSIRLVAIAVLARVLVPALVGVLASRLLTSFASAAFRSPALGIIGLVVVGLCLAAALVTISLPLKVGHLRPAMDDYRRNDEGA